MCRAFGSTHGGPKTAATPSGKKAINILQSPLFESGSGFSNEAQRVLRRRRILAILSLFLFLAAIDLAEGREKIKHLNPTFRGSTGLFNLFKPATLRCGEWSLALHGTSIHREPGDLNLSQFPLSMTLGVHDRLEFFFSWETYRRVRAGAIQVNKMAGPDTVLPSRLATGTLGFFNDLPFLDVPLGQGRGEFWTGLKLNLLSELSGAPLGWAVQAKTRFSIEDSRDRLLQGLTAGTTDVGCDLLFSKAISDGPNLVGNAGILFVQDSFDADRQHEFKYGTGLELPFWRDNARLIGELVGTHFFGSHSPSTFVNPVSPLDLLAGIRLLSFRRLHLSGAYRSNLRTIDPELLGIAQTGRHGWFLQIVLQRKINRPPSVQCSVDQDVLVRGDVTTVRVTVSDPDDEILGITWEASSGRITLNGNSAIFDSTGLPAGQYTVNTELDDGESTSGCTVYILVREKNFP